MASPSQRSSVCPRCGSPMVSGTGKNVGDLHETGSTGCVRAAVRNLLEAEELVPVRDASEAQGLALTGAEPRYAPLNTKDRQRTLVVPYWRLMLYRAFKPALVSARAAQREARDRRQAAEDVRRFGDRFERFSATAPAFDTDRLEDFLALADDVEGDEELRRAIVAVARLATKGHDPAEDVAELVIAHRRAKE